jgi:hypothetical protein
MNCSPALLRPASRARRCRALSGLSVLCRQSDESLFTRSGRLAAKPSGSRRHAKARAEDITAPELSAELAAATGTEIERHISSFFRSKTPVTSKNKECPGISLTDDFHFVVRYVPGSPKSISHFDLLIREAF